MPHRGDSLRSALAYDLVCTTLFERFSREMSIRPGSTRVIDEVEPHDFILLAQNIGMGAKHMNRISAELSNRIECAVINVGEQESTSLVAFSYTAEDLVDDMVTRLAVVAAA